MRKKILLGLLLALIVVGGVIIYRVGARNIIGKLRYDQRREGDLKVGDMAPDLTLMALNGHTQTNLRDYIGQKPLVLIFGSYT